MNLFELKNVKYKDILDIKHLTIADKKVTTLFGESGSGKSTLMKLLNQMISVDNGEIIYEGQNIEILDPIELRRKVVMLSQTPAIFDGNIRDNLLIGLRFSEKDDVEDGQLEKALNRVHLKKSLEANANDLSGGEKQRLAFARVVLMDVPVYLLDEPTSALDEDTELLVMNDFKTFARTNNKTVIMVTHSKMIAEEFSDQIIYMKEINNMQKEGKGHND